MNPLVDTFKNRFNQLVSRYFVDVATGARPGALGKDTVFLQFTLGANREEYPNNIIQNDPIRFSAYVVQTGEDQYEMELKPSVGGLKPTEKYFAQSSIKISGRKTKGNAEKIMKQIDKMLAKTADVVAEQAEQGNFLSLPYNPNHKVQSFWIDL